MDQSPPPAGMPQPPIQPLLVREPAASTPVAKSRWFVRLLFIFLGLALGGSILMNVMLVGVVGVLGFASGDMEDRVQEKFVSHNRFASDKVAILSIEGTILSGEGFFKQQLDHARKDIADGHLKALVVRVNSPGGTITGSDYMLHYLQKLAAETKTPIVVSMGGLAASGGYFVSMCVGDQVDSIYAEPTTWTGSIGVIIPHYNVVDLMQKVGIQEDAVVSHHLKGMGSIARRMTEEERAIFQGLVNEGFTQFKDVIKQGRPKFREDPTALDKLATGQVFTAQQALENGLIDRIGFVEDAIDRAIALAHLDKNNVKIVKYKAETRLSDIFLGEAQLRSRLDIAKLFESTTPQAYYLCTWLPTVFDEEK